VNSIRLTQRCLISALLATFVVTPSLVADDECGTPFTPDDLDVARKLISVGAYDVPPAAPRYTLEVPMTIHIVRRTNGTGGIAQADVDQTIADANANWAATGMSFFQEGATRFINSDAFYFDIDTQAEIDALKQTDVIAGTINVYFTQNVGDEGGGLCGQSSFTSTAIQGLVMANGCTAQSGNTSTFSHETGHYFDLLHTHQGSECPDGSNCSTEGDLLCDTPADPGLNDDNVTDCIYVGTETRCGDPFHPDPRNFMASGGVRECRDRFSPGQRNRALATLINLRSSLIESPGLNVTWVHFAYSGTELGTYSRPFNDLVAALAATAPNGRIVIKTGSSSTPITISQACVLDSFRGSAIIGN
jgi:hypothetical protein